MEISEQPQKNAERINQAGLTGVLAINKPAGMTSKDVSRRLGPLLPRKIKIGHVGTLDPIATGVLPIVLGRATRLQDILLDVPKTYLFDVEFGYETETLDLEGPVVRTVEGVKPSVDEVAKVLPFFVGEIEQVPPLYSAVKYKGKPLHRYAREDRSQLPDLNELKRKVVIHRLEVVEGIPNGVRLIATSSRGTYVRALARDIAAKLGSLGTVTMLKRTHSAGIDIAQCVDLSDLVEGRRDLGAAVLPIEKMAEGIPYLRSLAPVWTKRLRQGQRLKLRRDMRDMALDGQNVSGILNRDLLLLSDHGTVFGLGNAAIIGPDEFVVNMKRGL